MFRLATTSLTTPLYFSDHWMSLENKLWILVQVKYFRYRISIYLQSFR